MGRSYEQQADFSARAFREVVWPEIGARLGGGALRLVEGGTAHAELDTRGGVDAYQVFRTGVRTIAQRTQRLDDYEKPRTFTIRKTLASGGTTELEKRLAALSSGNDLPAITVQAYVHWKTRTFGCAGVVHTRPFYLWVADPGFRDGPAVRLPPRATWPPHGVIRHEAPRVAPREMVEIKFETKANRDDGNEFLVVPWSDIVMYSEVPFASMDTNVTARSPSDFFAGWPEGRQI